MRGARNDVQADVTITLRWDDRTKVWRLMAQDREGNVLHRVVVDTTAAVDRYAASRLLRAVGDELALFLPF